MLYNFLKRDNVVLITDFNEAPVEQELRLSDAFMTNAAECGKISLEVVVKFINVNYEKGAELLTKCKTMQGYSVLIYKIREKSVRPSERQMGMIGVLNMEKEKVKPLDMKSKKQKMLLSEQHLRQYMI